MSWLEAIVETNKYMNLALRFLLLQFIPTLYFFVLTGPVNKKKIREPPKTKSNPKYLPVFILEY